MVRARIRRLGREPAVSHFNASECERPDGVPWWPVGSRHPGQRGPGLEAARWAPSSYNEQPWRFLVAKREDREPFDRLFVCLNEGNREWASGRAGLRGRAG